jgi:hypothetical protein
MVPFVDRAVLFATAEENAWAFAGSDALQGSSSKWEPLEVSFC